MVLKLLLPHQYFFYMFENDVKMYGTQAILITFMPSSVFENDVKMYGTQASRKKWIPYTMFENDVKMYGTQAHMRVVV